MPVNHYENFPVGSLILPHRLRRPIHAVYAFARHADDLTDEGSLTPSQRLSAIDQLKDDLDRTAQGRLPQHPLTQRLQQEVLLPFRLPLQPFYDLLSAFRQDISIHRYTDYAQLADYCRRSANPIGRIMLHLYDRTDPLSIAQSDGICTALQLINFCQDIQADYQKGRIYLPQEEMAKFAVSETQLSRAQADRPFQDLMAFQCRRAGNILKAGAPLGKSLSGRCGFELRMIIAGGHVILRKMQRIRYNIFRQRPQLNGFDWLNIIKHAILKK